MNIRKKGLGRGLDALLSPRGKADEQAPSNDEVHHLPVDRMQRGQYQPRTHMDESALAELASSIKSQGLVQPIVVRPVAGDGRYEIIAGERRWRAAQMAGLHDVPVVVRDVSDQTAMCIALIENIQREELNPIEEARALSRLLKEFEMTHETVADAVGRSRSAVSNLLRLLELQPEVRTLVEQGQLEMGHARALLALKNREQVNAARHVVKAGLSVRATEAYVKSQQKAGSKSKAQKPARDPNIISLERDMSDYLGSPVNIRHKSGKGTVEIRYHSLDQLQGILEKIKK